MWRREGEPTAAPQRAVAMSSSIGGIVSERFSRGEIISLIAGVPGAIAVTTEAVSAADNKKQFKYQDKPAKNGQKCSHCRLFRPPMGCKVVTGKISLDGWCIAWVKR
jgi:hypothetical protein